MAAMKAGQLGEPYRNRSRHPRERENYHTKIDTVAAEPYVGA
jgi:hypothetical protein